MITCSFSVLKNSWLFKREWLDVDEEISSKTKGEKNHFLNYTK